MVCNQKTLRYCQKSYEKTGEQYETTETPEKYSVTSRKIIMQG